MQGIIVRTLASLSLLSVASAAWAGNGGLCVSTTCGPIGTVPEPGVLELAALGAAVAFAISLSKRRKK